MREVLSSARVAAICLAPLLAARIGAGVFGPLPAGDASSPANTIALIAFALAIGAVVWFNISLAAFSGILTALIVAAYAAHLPRVEFPDGSKALVLAVPFIVFAVMLACTFARTKRNRNRSK